MKFFGISSSNIEDSGITPAFWFDSCATLWNNEYYLYVCFVEAGKDLKKIDVRTRTWLQVGSVIKNDIYGLPIKVLCRGKEP